MSNTIDQNEVIKMILSAVDQIKGNHETLSKLDAATGDGDHGTTMLRTVKAIEDTISGNAGDKLGELLGKIGWGIMSADGGSTGPLLGSFFMGLGESVGDKVELDVAAVADMLVAGVEKMHKQSRAQVGDKTMMDALLPAADALKAADKSAGIADVLAQAAKAAAEGSDATTDMVAKFGRARNLGERVLGHKDPGSVSMALIFRGFADSFAK